MVSGFIGFDDPRGEAQQAAGGFNPLAGGGSRD
jgi:hypothetical protein